MAVLVGAEDVDDAFDDVDDVDDIFVDVEDALITGSLVIHLIKENRT